MIVFLLGVASLTWAAPAPDGWTSTRARDATVYAPADRRDIELRLHTPADSAQDVARWFADRVRQPPSSVADLRITKTDVQRGVHVAMASAQRGSRSDRGSTATRSTREPRGGRYELAGYLLTLQFDDGTVQRRTIAFDPQKPDQIYLDGAAYAVVTASER